MFSDEKTFFYKNDSQIFAKKFFHFYNQYVKNSANCKPIKTLILKNVFHQIQQFFFKCKKTTMVHNFEMFF